MTKARVRPPPLSGPISSHVVTPAKPHRTAPTCQIILPPLHVLPGPHELLKRQLVSAARQTLLHIELRRLGWLIVPLRTRASFCSIRGEISPDR
jgi:hypothetical protein